MNIEDFLLTVMVSSIAGLIAGYLLRDLSIYLFSLYRRFIRKPKYFQKVVFDKPQPLPKTK